MINSTTKTLKGVNSHLFEKDLIVGKAVTGVWNNRARNKLTVY